MKTFSRILLTTAGLEYECLYVGIDSNGRMIDSVIWNNSDLRQKIANNDSNIRDLSPMSYGNLRKSHLFDVFVGETNKMKPCLKKISRKIDVQLPLQ